MNEKKPISKSVAAVSVALAVVLLLVLAVFVFGKREDGRSEIVLPETQTQNTAPDMTKPSQEEKLLQITPDNVVEALSSLERPTHYTHSYRVQVGGNTAAYEATVELWVNGVYKRAQIKTEALTKILVTDGNAVWIWYSSAEVPHRFEP